LFNESLTSRRFNVAKKETEEERIKRLGEDFGAIECDENGEVIGDFPEDGEDEDSSSSDGEDEDSSS
jgi:hypothetical protein